MTFLRRGEAAKTEADVEGVERLEQRENGGGGETFNHISKYLFKLPSRHIDLHRNGNINLYSTCMEFVILGPMV